MRVSQELKASRTMRVSQELKASRTKYFLSHSLSLFQTYPLCFRKPAINGL